MALGLFFFFLNRASAQDVEEIIRQSIKTKFPNQTPSLPVIQISRALFEKDKIIPLLLKSKPAPIKEELTIGDLVYYTTNDGKELDFYPSGAFSYLYPVGPGEKLLTTSAEQAKTDINSFLADFGGLPEDAKLYDSGKLQGGVGSADAVLYYFLYSHAFHDVPVETDVIRVVAGGSRVVEFSFAWSAALKESASVPIKKSQECYRSALKYYYEKILGGKYKVPSTLTGVKLFYYFKTEKDFENLVPVWRYTLTSPIGYLDAGQKGKPASKAAVIEIGTAVIRVNALTGDVIR
ncbi:MAG: hypothetical protein ACREJQ_02500 [bacterium]